MAKVLVVYHSDTGNTERAAELVADGARAVVGVEVEVLRAMDVDPEAVVSAAGVAIGSPDYYHYMAGEVKVFFDRVFHVRDRLKGKPCVSFITHGGGGKALGSVVSLCGSVYMEQAAEAMAIKGRPSGDDEEKCRDLGRKLAEKAAG